MRLKDIEINNFRSIKSCHIVNSDITSLVGENNTGKSAILRALNAFFNFDEEKHAFENGYHQYSSNSKTNIILTFEEIPYREIYKDKQNEKEELIIRMTYSKKRRTFFYKQKNKFHQLSNDFIDEMKKDINFVLIPPYRHYKQLIWEKNSLLKQVLTEYLHEITKNRDMLTSQVIKATDGIDKYGFAKIEKGIEKFYGLSKSFNYKIQFEQEIDYSILLNNIMLNIEEHGNTYNILDSGSGIQSLTIIALYRYLSQLQHNNIILGLEEPEINLHPQAQREFINSIKKSNETETSVTQLIFTTHSPIIIDQLGHDEVALCRKVKDQSRGFKTEVYQIPKQFWELYGLEEYKYYGFYSYRNSEFFFAKFIIIAEGKNDAEVVRLLLEQKNIDITSYGVTIINLDGVKNLSYPYYLLKYLQIPYVIILDKDYFVPYTNDSFKESQNSTGFPKYKDEFDKNHYHIINEIIPDKVKQEELLNYFKTNHTKVLDFLQRRNVICMKYFLEIDLVASKTATREYCNILKIPVTSVSETELQRQLLFNYTKAIKKINNIIEVLSKLPHKNLPNSYKRIKKVLADRIVDSNSI